MDQPAERKAPKNLDPSPPVGTQPLGIHSRAVSDASEQIMQLRRRRSMLVYGSLPDSDLIDVKVTPGRSSLGNPRAKRNSVMLSHTPFPALFKSETLGADGLVARKSDLQLKEEIALLKSFGLKTGDDVPAELNIFKERREARLVMSTFDLWGPDHARQAVRAMGCLEAFRTLERRDKLATLKFESLAGERYNPRMADDAASLKVHNAPMVTSAKFVDTRPVLHTDRGKQEPVSTRRGHKLQSILQSLDRLSEDSRALRRSLAPLTSVPNLRRKPVMRNSIS